MATSSGAPPGPVRDLGAARSARERHDDQVLRVEDLSIGTKDGTTLVSSTSFDLAKGKVMGLVGESGSGKTLTSLAVIGLLPHRVSITGGSISFRGTELVGQPESVLRRHRGSEIGIVFQNAMTSLNPAFRVGRSLERVLRRNTDLGARARDARIVELGEMVGLPNPALNMRQYPHELSGGMRQRVMIAMAISCEPALVIADEPTTALDVTTQAQILHLIRDLCVQLDVALLLVTHDLGVVAEACDSVSVMYAGQIVESGPVVPLFSSPKHPYTAALLASIHTIDDDDLIMKGLEGRVPDPGQWPEGCRFLPRCAFADQQLCSGPTPLQLVGDDQHTRCRRMPELRLPGVVERASE